MSDKPISDVLFQIAYDVGQGVLSATLDDDVEVIGHNDKDVQLEALTKTHTIQAVYDQAFYYVTSEKMAMLNGIGGDKV